MVPKRSQNGAKEGPDGFWNRVWVWERFQTQIPVEYSNHFGAKIGPKLIQKRLKNMKKDRFQNRF